MALYRDHHVTIFVSPDVAGPIEATRRKWDPVMATQVPAHVSLAYPHEVPIVDLLTSSAMKYCARRFRGLHFPHTLRSSIREPPAEAGMVLNVSLS